MSNFNQISVNSPISINYLDPAYLCFIDDKIISNNKFSLVDNNITLLRETGNTLSLFYNNGVMDTYEFNSRLYMDGTQLPNTDINDDQVQNLTSANLLVFVDGILQDPDQYYVLDGNTLTFSYAYTTNPNTYFKIIVCNIQNSNDFIRATVTPTLDTEREEGIIIPVNYDINNTLIFINGKKVSYKDIELLDSGTSSNPRTRLNIKMDLQEIERLEYIQFNQRTNTSSLNFTTEFGYLTYGPFDDFNNKIPQHYDTIVTFTDQAKILVDNFRPGFIIKEKDRTGELLVVDSNFETTQIKCLALQTFGYTNYTKDEYYIEVPQYTSITKYLAEFDKKFTFIPEILEIFQRLLLDEINDSIQRIRDIRNIHKVDSENINKLISLLGFNLNIKTLTKKQRMELLEELNEFYRCAGTRNSYNILNILQNDLKLINMEQLFTPHFPRKKESLLYNYDFSMNDDHRGIGYIVGQILTVANDSHLEFEVTDVDADGRILDYQVIGASEGYSDRNSQFNLIQAGTFSFDVSSTTSGYSYIWNVTNSTRYTRGTRLKTLPININNTNTTFRLTVDEVDEDGTITNFTPDQSTHGMTEINVNLAQLYEDKPVPMLTVNSTYHNELTGEVEVFRDTTGGHESTITLQPGHYAIVLSGAGGAGGAGDSRSGNEYDLPATNGCAGELITKYITLDSPTELVVKVGQGGGRVKARGHDSRCQFETLGSGFHSGNLGTGVHINFEVQTIHTGAGGYTYSSTANVQVGNVGGGQGGGSSGVLFKNSSEVIAEARGGNGGYGYVNKGARYSIYTIPKNFISRGGTGGGGGVTNGTGAPGGNRNNGSSSFWSYKGADGWVIIKKLPLIYDHNITIPSGASQLDPSKTYETLESYQQQFTYSYDTASSSWIISPYTGEIPVHGTFELRETTENRSAKLNITSTSGLQAYNVKLNASNFKYIKPGFVFKNASTDPMQFTYTVETVSDTHATGYFTPQLDWPVITLQHTPAYLQGGSGAAITITSSENSQRNEDREYIDFYTRQQLGAVSHKEYRIDQEDYGTITVGTPNAPEWWSVGEPDIDYGYITDTADEIIDYGLITTKIMGEWVEWWEWDRSSVWYPTNHVDIEMKLPIGVNFEDYTDRFIDQFYNLASTVVFIHSIIQSFYFGKDIAGSIADPNELTGASFGIVTGQPYQEEWISVTSNPQIQAIAWDNKCTITINPTPSTATVVFNTPGVIEGNSITVNRDTLVSFTVSAPGYFPVTRIVHAYNTETIDVELEATGRCILTISTLNVEDANIVLTAPGYTQSGNSIAVAENTEVTYTVSKPGHVTVTDTVVVTADRTIYVALEIAQFTLTITPTPSDATVLFEPDIEILNMGQVSDSNIEAIIDGGTNFVDSDYINLGNLLISSQGNSITVDYGTNVRYTISKPGFSTVTGNVVVNSDINIPVVLTGPATLTIDPTPSDATVTFNTQGQVSGNSITVPEGTNVSYTVSKNGLNTENNSITVNSNTTLPVILTATFTINPTPSNLTVVLTAPGYSQSENSITVPVNTMVNYSVIKNSYEKISKTINLNANVTKNISINTIGPVQSLANNDWRGIDYGNGNFSIIPYPVANSAVYSSDEGNTWSNATMQQTSGTVTFRGPKYLNNNFIKISASGKGSTSADGTVWSNITELGLPSTGSAGSYFGICYGNNIWVAATMGGYVTTSSSGTGNWSALTQRFPLHTWNILAFGNGKFVALDGSGYVATSTDGITWTDHDRIANLYIGPNYWRDLKWDSNTNQFVALSLYGHISTSVDGITWTPYVEDPELTSISSEAYVSWLGIAFSPATILFVSNSGYLHKIEFSEN